MIWVTVRLEGKVESVLFSTWEGAGDMLAAFIECGMECVGVGETDAD